MKKFFIALVFIISSTAINAESLSGKYQACLTEELLDQLVRASARNDANAWKYLMANGCITPKAGIPVSLIDTTWSGKVKVRAYLNDASLELWTVRENIIVK